MGEVKLTYEELSTLLALIEACLNLRTLVALPHPEDGMEGLTPGHFLIGAAVEEAADTDIAPHSVPLLRRWSLCQYLTQHLWKRWPTEYVDQLNWFSKWNRTFRNVQIGDVACVHDE